MAYTTFPEAVSAYSVSTEELRAALLAGARNASGSMRAAVELIVEHGTWLVSDELLFAVRVVRQGDELVAAVDWGRIDLDDWEEQGDYQILLLAQLLAGVPLGWGVEDVLDGLDYHETNLATRALSRAEAGIGS